VAWLRPNPSLEPTGPPSASRRPPRRACPRGAARSLGAAELTRWGAEKSSGQFYRAWVAGVTARPFGLAGEKKSA